MTLTRYIVSMGPEDVKHLRPALAGFFMAICGELCFADLPEHGITLDFLHTECCRECSTKYRNQVV